MTGPHSRPVLALMACLQLSAAAFADGPDLWAIPDEGQRLRASVEYLSGLGSRISGHEGGRRAGDWIERQLSALDLGAVHRETFPITVPVELGGRSRLEIVGTDEEFDMYGLWPNGPRTTTTPPEGLQGQLTWVGNGEYTDFEGRQLHGRVVLMEFNTWDRWVRLAALGAKAVIFIEPAETSYPQTEDKSLIVPVDVPRFWIGAEAGRQLRRRLEGGAEIGVRLHSRMDWLERPCANLWVEVTGADTALARQRIVVQSYYDGTSIAPSLAPSAEASSGAAAMLELARHLRDHRPARTVVLLLTGSHFQDRAGIVDFIERHTRKSDYFAPLHGLHGRRSLRRSRPVHQDRPSGHLEQHHKLRPQAVLRPLRAAVHPVRRGNGSRARKGGRAAAAQRHQPHPGNGLVNLRPRRRLRRHPPGHARRPGGPLLRHRPRRPLSAGHPTRHSRPDESGTTS